MNARDIIEKWPSRVALASDIDESEAVASAWWQRNSIPGRADVAIVEAAAARGIQGITFEAIARTRAPKPAHSTPARIEANGCAQ